MTKTTVPITRTVLSTHYTKDKITTVTLNKSAWVVGEGQGVSLGTQLPDIRILKPARDFVFAQVVINLFLFNKLDARRIVLDGEQELIYMIKLGETVVIPPLPDFKGVQWMFTLGGTRNKDPLLRFKFNDVINSHTSNKKRKISANPK